MSREYVVLRYPKRVKRHFGGYGQIFLSVNDTVGYLDIDDFVTIEVKLRRRPSFDIRKKISHFFY